MKKTFKFTGQNIAAAVLVIAYFLPWITISFTGGFSGFDLTTTSISPGFFSRLLLIFLILIPACGAFILWQNYSPSPQYAKYINKAHYIPLLIIVIEIIIIYMKMKSSMGGAMSDAGIDASDLNNLGVKTPSVFDMFGFGIYLSILASIYLFLINRGIVKDKDFSSKTAPSQQ
jgi:hypothetical protein